MYLKCTFKYSVNYTYIDYQEHVKDTCFRTSLHLASILRSASLSARVGPMFKRVMGFFISDARKTNRYPEYTYKGNEKLLYYKPAASLSGKLL